MAKEAPDPSKDPKPPTRFVLRAALALLLCVLVTLYTAGVVSGFVGEERRIDVVNLAMIALAVFCSILLLLPDVFERLKLFEMAGFRLEMRERVIQVERALSAQDERITELLMISMSESIFKHLCGIACLKNYRYRHFDLFQREIYFLKDNGFIRLKPRHERVEFDEGFADKNLVEVAEPTEAGWSIIRLRKNDIPRELKEDERNINKDIPPDILNEMMNKGN